MKFLKPGLTLAATAAMLALPLTLAAQTNAPTVVTTNAVPEVRQNTAIIPVPRTGSITNRQSLVLQRAKDAPGNYDIEFIGDSITQGWEGRGTNVWQEFYGRRKTINFGVSGDRIQHVLWRFEQGQLDGIKARVAVVMIGTNNSNKDDNTEADILEASPPSCNKSARGSRTRRFCCWTFFRGAKPSARSAVRFSRSTRRSPGSTTAATSSTSTSAPSTSRTTVPSPNPSCPTFCIPTKPVTGFGRRPIEPKLKQFLGE